MSLLRKVKKGALILGLFGSSIFANAQEQNLNYSKLNVNQIYLTSCVNDQPCTNKSKDVLLEDKVNLNLVIETIKDGKKAYFSKSNNVELNGKKIDVLDIKNLNSTKYNIDWFKVEPEKEYYNNWKGWETVNGPSKFQWDTPEYTESLLNKNKWIVNADAKTIKDLDNKGFGTMRYKVELEKEGKKFSTKGKESINHKGIKEEVHRISFRKDNSFLGWLTSYFNVPYIYGNTKEQADQYIGVDCADLIIAGYRKMGNDLEYTSVAGLKNIFPTVINQKDISISGEDFHYKGKPIRYGKDVKNEDLILFGINQLWHVGALAEDKSNPNGPYKGKPDGILNTYDLMIQTFEALPEKHEIGDYGDFSILRK